ncbi:MAG: hypothetical protein GF335_01305 [Candidatus Moranbacteria bacterium]|nr:hypothetical protein [Candidatus Moranbacteria bacterium]
MVHKYLTNSQFFLKILFFACFFCLFSLSSFSLIPPKERINKIIPPKYKIILIKKRSMKRPEKSKKNPSKRKLFHGIRIFSILFLFCSIFLEESFFSFWA